MRANLHQTAPTSTSQSPRSINLCQLGACVGILGRVARKKRQVERYTVSLPVELKRQLEAMADRNYRLLSQEIVHDLQQYVQEHGDQPPPPPKAD